MADAANFLEVEGSTSEMGRQKARFDGHYLDEVLAYYDRKRNARFDAWISEKAIPYTEEHWPDLAEEVQGYLDESGYDKHAMYRYLFSQAKRMFTCSNIAAKTEDVGYVFAKNTDLNHWEFPFIVFLHYKPDRGQEFFGYSYKACLMVQGMNRSGLCNGGTSFSGVVEDESKMPDTGCPAQFIHRKNMQYAETVDRAVENLRQGTMFDKGAGLIFMDAQGGCKSVNHSLTILDVKDNTTLPVFCAGFFDMDRYEYREDYLPIVEMNKARITYAENYFRDKQKIYLQDVIDFLRSHGPDWSKPGQWCRHHPQSKSLCTCVSHICIPSQNKVLYCHGNPCRTPYKEFVFDS